MLIAFCIFKSFPHGGIPRDLMKIARVCRARGHQVRIYAARWEGERPAGMELVVVPVRGLTNHARYERFAARVQLHLQSHPADLVVGMNKMPGLDVYYAGDSCYEEKVRTQRSALYRLLPRYRHFSRFEHAVFDPAAATRILTISDVEIPHFRRHYGTPAERFHPLPPGIDRDRRAPADPDSVRAGLRAEAGVGVGEQIVLFLGSGFTKKGLDRALRAFRALPPERYRMTWLFVVGQDKAEPFQRLARSLGVAERVRFFGGRDDVPRFLAAADGLVLPAYDENAGMAILEAMIAGLPALVTANCGYAGYVREARAGLVAEMPFDQRTFDAQFLELLTSPERPRWRANGLALAADERIYALAEAAADYLEQFAAPAPDGRSPLQRAMPNRSGGSPRKTGVPQFLREDLAQTWASSEDVFERVQNLEGDIYRAVADRRTLRFEAGGRAYFAKIHQGAGWREILKNLISLRLPVVGARNEYEACLHLARAGVAAPTVAAFGERGRSPAARLSFVVCDALEGRESLEELTDRWDAEPPTPLQQRRLVMAVAAFARAMHAAGVIHRDFYICHLLLDRAAYRCGRVDLAVIDLHRAQIHQHPPLRWLRRDLAALLFSTLDLPLSRRAWLRFVRVYSGRPLPEVMREDGAFWAGVYGRARALYAKGQRKDLVKGRFPPSQRDD
jgi:UDP-glucose:(heptosyl)LPS alpha-1,3-glucosyltransferase